MDSCSQGSISFWMDEQSEFPTTPALKKNITTDVCIVGAGIAGISCAYMLAKQGQSVVVIDGLQPGGQTVRSTGHLSNVLDDRYYDLEELFGKKGAKLAAESHAAAIDLIEDLVAKENIECDFERLNGYLFVPPDQSQDILDRELKATHRAGINVEKVVRAPFASFDTGPCLEFHNQAQFHPEKYLAGLTQAAVRAGVEIFYQTQAQEFISGTSCKVTTDAGFEIKARALIVATNTPVNDRVIMHTKQAAYRTYVIAAKVPSEYVPKALYWDTLDPYHYIRVQSLSKTEDLLIIGGEDHKTGQKKDPTQCYAQLENWARERFPEMGEITYRWSGQVMEPIDSLAFIGRNPLDRDNVFIVTGDSGNGLTHGTIAGMLLSDLVMGKRNPWETLYDPSRKTIGAVSEFLKENINVAACYTDWLMPNGNMTEKEIKPCSGGVLKDGLKKKAVYRDEEGKLHYFSAACPHLGCIVAWNDAENTWDCPCHGSRFDAYGKVLNGPTTRGLTPETKP